MLGLTSVIAILIILSLIVALLMLVKLVHTKKVRILKQVKDKKITQVVAAKTMNLSVTLPI